MVRKQRQRQSIFRAMAELNLLKGERLYREEISSAPHHDFRVDRGPSVVRAAAILRRSHELAEIELLVGSVQQMARVNDVPQAPEVNWNRVETLLQRSNGLSIPVPSRNRLTGPCGPESYRHQVPAAFFNKPTNCR